MQPEPGMLLRAVT